MLEGRSNEVEGHINRDLLPVEHASQLLWGGAGEGQGRSKDVGIGKAKGLHITFTVVLLGQAEPLLLHCFLQQLQGWQTTNKQDNNKT